MMVMMDSKFHLVRGDLSTEPSCQLSCVSEQVKISKVMIWNPYLGKTRWFWVNNIYFHHDMYFNYAFGYEDKRDKSCRTHKFLRFKYYTPKDHFVRSETYDFDSGLWTSVDVAPHCVIEQPGKIAMGFDGGLPIKLNIIGDDGYFRELDVLGAPGDQRYCMPPMCSSYVPSLVHIKKPARGQNRKKKTKRRRKASTAKASQ
ncbi:unnamed protein product, partial [Thlaspi arvense]